MEELREKNLFCAMDQISLNICMGNQPTAAQTAVCLKVDLSTRSTLKWLNERDLAKKYSEEGFFILWDLEMGLFDKLEMPLDDEGQRNTLELGLQHFSETLYEEFKDKTVGALVYKGSLELSLDFLKSIVAILPDALMPFLFLDLASIASKSDYFKFLTQDDLAPFYLAIKNGFQKEFPHSIPSLSWEDGGAKAIEKKALSLGILLPSTEKGWEDFESFLMQTKMRDFRAISETQLDKAWDGLDELIIFPDAVKPQGRRKIEGFLAAGGRVIHANAFMP